MSTKNLTLALALCFAATASADHHHHDAKPADDKHHHHHKDKKDDAAKGDAPAPAADAKPAEHDDGFAPMADSPKAEKAATTAVEKPAPKTAEKPAEKPAAPRPDEAPGARPSQAQGELRDMAGSSPSDRPWAKSVSPAQQQKALALFRDGNGLLKESLFVQAAAKYRDALRVWDHPAIHYNLALALLNLDQPVEVYSQLQEAMKYGPAPLDADKFDHATRYKALIEKQLAHVDVSCGEKEAVVTMDGRTLFTAPGHYTAYVRTGPHTFLATKTGYVTTQKTPTLEPGQKVDLDMRLYTADDLTTYRRRWAVWMPWTVLAAGVAVAAVGGVLHWQASEQYKSFDAGITACGGCVPSGDLASKRAAGDTYQSLAFFGYGIGGAAIVAGAVLATMNRAKPYRLSPDESNRLSLSPYVGPGGAGLVSTLHF